MRPVTLYGLEVDVLAQGMPRVQLGGKGGCLELDNQGARWPKIIGSQFTARLFRVDVAEQILARYPELRIAARFLTVQHQPTKISAPFPGYYQLDAPKFVGLELVDRKRLLYQAWPGQWMEQRIARLPSLSQCQLAVQDGERLFFDRLRIERFSWSPITVEVLGG